MQEEIIKADDIAIGAENVAKKGKPKEPKPKTAAEQTAKAKTEKQAFMYLGPNLPGGRLFCGNLFKCNSLDEIPHLGGVFEKIPEVKQLFAEVKQVPMLQKQLKEQGTRAYGLYQHTVSLIAAAIKEGVFKDGI